jgi:hypothetical protein
MRHWRAGSTSARTDSHHLNIEGEGCRAAEPAARHPRRASALQCQHGADRTGMISELYRILYQGWSKVAALDEMQNGMFGYHAVWGNIPRFIRRVDVEELRRDVGVP